MSSKDKTEKSIAELSVAYWSLRKQLTLVEGDLAVHAQAHITQQTQVLHDALIQAAGQALAISRAPESHRCPTYYKDRLEGLHTIIAENREKLQKLLEASQSTEAFLDMAGFPCGTPAELPAPLPFAEESPPSPPKVADEELPFKETPEPEAVVEETPAPTPEPEIKRVGGSVEGEVLAEAEEKMDAAPNPLQEALLESATQDYPGMAEKLAVAELTYVENDNKVLVKNLPMTGNERRWFTQKVRDILGDRVKIDSP